MTSRSTLPDKFNKYRNNRADMKHYKLIIEIGSNVTDIMHLECVQGVFKNFAGELIYQVNTTQSSITYAVKGDLICQDYEECWHVVSNRV